MLSVSALWIGSAVSPLNDAREVQMSMRALCCCARLSGLVPSCMAVMDRGHLTAVTFEVSVWTCARTVHTQAASTASTRRSVSPTWLRS